MDIRTAILKAADHIEANPDSLYYFNPRVPADTGSGCPGAWIGHFLGLATGSPEEEWCLALTGADTNKAFLSAMSEIWRTSAGRGAMWQKDHRAAAACLRLYADKYHPEETTEEYPSIRAELDRIANMQVERAGTG